MGLISGLLMFPVTGPLRGLELLLEQLQEEAERAMQDRGIVQAELYELSLSHDLGEMPDDEYEKREAALLERLNAILSPDEDPPTSEEALEDDEW